jgi:hypothetical protein
MISRAEIIEMPCSGMYPERIFDQEDTPHQDGWTFVLFTHQDGAQWCGHFRGLPKGAAVSLVHQIALVLTSTALYRLDCEVGVVQESVSHFEIHSLTLTPQGHFLIADEYGIQIIATSLTEMKSLEFPILVDSLEFGKWNQWELELKACHFSTDEQIKGLVFDSTKASVLLKQPNSVPLHK